jgi:hypothetical protein
MSVYELPLVLACVTHWHNRTQFGTDGYGVYEDGPKNNVTHFFLGVGRAGVTILNRVVFSHVRKAAKSSVMSVRQSICQHALARLPLHGFP